MNATATRERNPSLAVLADDELLELVARLQRQVEAMRHAQGEVGIRIRTTYADALDQAENELQRRQI